VFNTCQYDSQGLAHVLKTLDRNFNLALAPGSSPPGDPGTSGGVAGELWCLLANCAAVVQPARVADGATIRVQVLRVGVRVRVCVCATPLR
jgi:hypothetical protein